MKKGATRAKKFGRHVDGTLIKGGDEEECFDYDELMQGGPQGGATSEGHLAGGGEGGDGMDDGEPYDDGGDGTIQDSDMAD